MSVGNGAPKDLISTGPLAVKFGITSTYMHNVVMMGRVVHELMSFIVESAPVSTGPYPACFASSRRLNGVDDVQLIEVGQRTSLPMIARTCRSLSL
jgi:hypothetical protein